MISAGVLGRFASRRRNRTAFLNVIRTAPRKKSATQSAASAASRGHNSPPARPNISPWVDRLECEGTEELTYALIPLQTRDRDGAGADDHNVDRSARDRRRAAT